MLPLVDTIINFALEHPEGFELSYFLRVFYGRNLPPSRSPEYKKLHNDVSYLFRKLEQEGLLSSLKISRRKRLWFVGVDPNVISLLKRPQSKIQTLDPWDVAHKLAWMSESELTGRFKILDRMFVWKMLSEEQKDQIFSEFQRYLRECLSRVIILVDKESLATGNEAEKRFLIIPYLVRFLKREWYEEHNRKISAIFRNAQKRYKWAVHLTLTVDPKRFDSNIELVYEARRQVNSLMTNLRKQSHKHFNRRISFFKATEFTESGLIHFHLVIFGRRWIRKAERIAKELWKLGYVDVYQLVSTREGWTYPRKRPRDFQDKLRKVKGRSDASAYFYFSLPLPSYPRSDFRKNSSPGSLEQNALKRRKKTSIIPPSKLEELDDYWKINLALLWVYNLRPATASRILLPGSTIQERSQNWMFWRSAYLWELEALKCFWERLEASLINIYEDIWDEIDDFVT